MVMSETRQQTQQVSEVLQQLTDPINKLTAATTQLAYMSFPQVNTSQFAIAVQAALLATIEQQLGRINPQSGNIRPAVITWVNPQQQGNGYNRNGGSNKSQTRNAGRH